jgi:tetrahydromethanopterin S-methyltransferase subunit D
MKKVLLLLLISLSPCINSAEPAQTTVAPEAQVKKSCTFHKVNKVLLPGAFIGAALFGLGGAIQYFKWHRRQEDDLLGQCRLFSLICIDNGKYGFAMGYFWPVTAPILGYIALTHKQ